MMRHLCADKAHTGRPVQKVIEERFYVPRMKQRGEEIQARKNDPNFKAPTMGCGSSTFLDQSFQKAAHQV
jgi:hypothetical protein